MYACAPRYTHHYTNLKFTVKNLFLFALTIQTKLTKHSNAVPLDSRKSSIRQEMYQLIQGTAGDGHTDFEVLHPSICRHCIHEINTFN